MSTAESGLVGYLVPGSLHTGMTSRGYTNRGPVRIERHYRLGDFPVAESGLWLPPVEIGARDYPAALRLVGEWACRDVPSPDFKAETAAEALGNTSLETDTGCWRPAHNLAAGRYAMALFEISGLGYGADVLNPESAEPAQSLRICDCEQCLNPRHYDLTYGTGAGRVQRPRLLTPDYQVYGTLEDDRIKTSWGDILPSVEESVLEYVKLRNRCYPYADDQKAPLTANGISKISIDPATGCWTVRSYYIQPVTDTRQYQYDMYGRLTLRKHMQGGTKGSQMGAHRVVWLATGRKLRKGMELNHRCGFRPCANPLHLEPVSKSVNGRHGAKMRQARQH